MMVAFRQKLAWLAVVVTTLPGCSVAPTKSVQDKAADSRAEKEALLTQKLRCAQEAWRYDEREKKNLSRFLYFDISYAYNPKLNTCLYESGAIARPREGESYFEVRSIVDLLTNETLAEYTISSGPAKRSANDQGRIANFARQEKELFGHNFSGLSAP
jgi:hypothetical protein